MTTRELILSWLKRSDGLMTLGALNRALRYRFDYTRERVELTREGRIRTYRAERVPGLSGPRPIMVALCKQARAKRARKAK